MLIEQRKKKMKELANYQPQEKRMLISEVAQALEVTPQYIRSLMLEIKEIFKATKIDSFSCFKNVPPETIDSLENYQFIRGRYAKNYITESQFEVIKIYKIFKLQEKAHKAKVKLDHHLKSFSNTTVGKTITKNQYTLLEQKLNSQLRKVKIASLQQEVKILQLENNINEIENRLKRNDHYVAYMVELFLKGHTIDEIEYITINMQNAALYFGQPHLPVFKAWLVQAKVLKQTSLKSAFKYAPTVEFGDCFKYETHVGYTNPHPGSGKYKGYLYFTCEILHNKLPKIGAALTKAGIEHKLSTNDKELLLR
jgi:hypothetical protein